MLKRLLMLFALSAATFNACAESTPWYQIEVLVFDYHQPPATGAEHWPVFEQGIIDTLLQDGIQLTAPLAPGLDPELQPADRGFRQLNADDMLLHTRAQKLRNSRNYRVVLHTAWRQPVRGRESALPVVLDNMPELAMPADSGIAKPEFQMPPAYSQAAAGAESAVPQEPAEPHVRGLLSVGLSRYLHVDVDLYYRNPDIQPASVEWSSDPNKQYADTYQLHENRRMRSKEMHFLDHPYFGVLIYIVPLAR